MQKPLGLRQRALIHREPDEFDPEASTAELLADIHVGTVRDGVAVRDDAREAHLAAVSGVEANNAGSRRNELVDQFSAPAGGPVRGREERVYGRPVDAAPIVIEHESAVEVALHGPILPAGCHIRSGTVVSVGRVGIMLCVALPLAAADLLVKASIPTEPWAYHERSLGWLALSLGLFAALIAISRIPSALVAPAAGLLAAGLLGNSSSAAWNSMEVPNPLIAGVDRGLIAFNPADVFVLAGILALTIVIGIWLIRNRELIPPRDECGRAVAGHSDASSSRETVFDER